MTPVNRWYPVLERYVSYVSSRVNGFGGDAGEIKPSLTGVISVTVPEHKHTQYTGKVCEVIYNCFGEFEGFMLEKCCQEHRIFQSRERSIGELVLRACQERWSIAVTTDANKICGIRVFS
jgi:hypothetical protein